MIKNTYECRISPVGGFLNFLASLDHVPARLFILPRGGIQFEPVDSSNQFVVYHLHRSIRRCPRRRPGI